LTPDGKRVYYSPLTSNYLYSIPSVNLRAKDSDPLAELAAHSNISHHGQRGANANGFEGDSNGLIYQLMPTEKYIKQLPGDKSLTNIRQRHLLLRPERPPNPWIGGGPKDSLA
jgi:sugar lactone lactonase YvrE